MRALTFMVLSVLAAAQEARPADSSPRVSLSADQGSFTLANGLVAAKVSRESGDLISLVYRGVELLARPASGHPFAYWSHDARSTRQDVRVTIDPASNGGDRAEVSIKGYYVGTPLGQGPGGGFAADVEIRYALGRGDSGVYTYSILEHKPAYPNAVLGEARFAAKLGDAFDWMLVDQRHNIPISAMETPDYNKYNYTTLQFENPVYGFAGTRSRIGLFFVHASTEYLTGPPTKVEFLGHRHNTLLAYWRSSHYGGGTVDVAAGEHWTKVIGPIFLYANSGADPQVMWRDAREQQKKESAKWPYEWVRGVDYPRAAGRGTVKGKLRVRDPGDPQLRARNFRVGVAHPAYTVPTGRAAAQNNPAEVDWDTDSKHYSFWVAGRDDGSFEIPAVRPGTYTLHAFAEGALGEFARTDIVVAAGKTLDLGTMEWQLPRHGRTIWEIGEINRSGGEFAMAENYARNGIDRVFVESFAQGVRYVIGESHHAKDWPFRQVPYPGKPELTPWTIAFDMPRAPGSGTASLRIALAGKQSPAVRVTVNGKPAGEAGNLWFDSAVGRNQIRGLWALRDVAFDASLLKAGTNEITLSVTGGGVIYDYLRLELADQPR
jgi:rhamnogalacturonan endolyase